MAHVQVPDEVPRKQHTVGGAPTAGPFVFDFVIFDEGTDISVFDGATQLTPGDDFTVTGNPGTDGGFDGGSVTLTAPVSDTIITIERIVPLDRLGDFPNAGPFNIAELNTQLDRLVTLLQQINFKLRLAAIQDATAQILDLKLPAPAANQPIGWNATGDQLTNLAVAGLGIPVTLEQGGTGALNAADAIKNLVAAVGAHANLITDTDQLLILEAAANIGRKISPQLLVQPYQPIFGYRPGHFYFGQLDDTTTGTVTISTDALFAIPFLAFRPHNFQSIGCQVTTGVVGGTIRMGIYRDDGNGYPGALQQDVGTVTSDVVEVKEILDSIPLKAGPYWLTLISNVQPQFRRTAQFAPAFGAVVGMPDALLDSGNKRFNGVRVAQAFGDLPATFPGGGEYRTGVTGSMPRLFLRA